MQGWDPSHCSRVGGGVAIARASGLLRRPVARLGLYSIRCSQNCSVIDGQSEAPRPNRRSGCIARARMPPGMARQLLDAAEQDHVLLADWPMGRP